MKSILLLLILLLSSISYGQNLTANFSATPLEICLGEVITFSDLSTAGASPIQTWTWDFGDGFSSQNQNPTHTFTSAGTYNITLTVQALNGTSDVEIKQGYITVHPLPDVIFSLDNQACSLPFNALFTNSSSSGSHTYNWDFGNGQTSNDFTPTGVTYTAAGTFNVTLTITNTVTGCVNSLTTPIQVSNFEANFSLVDTVCYNQSVTINDASTAGVDTWSWDFGNGSTSTASTNSFTYAGSGTYTVTLTSSNSVLGCTDTHTETIVVLNSPTASFVADQTLGCPPMTVNFTNNSSTASTYSWNFGDGTTFQGLNPPPHIYTDTGSYDVTLIIIDDFGCPGYMVIPNLITVEDIQIGFIVNPMGGCDPLDVIFTDTSSVPNPAQDPIINWNWDFGNGNTYNGQFPPMETYNLGVYSVSLSLTTTSGCVADTVYTDSVTVGTIDTVGFTNLPIDVCAKEYVTFTNLTTISAPHDPWEVTYNWNFGDGGISVFENPSYGYQSDTGFFDVQLIVDFRGCQDTAFLPQAVHVNAPVSHFASSSILVCNPDSLPVSIDFYDNSVIGELSDDAEMIWSWGDSTFTYFDDPDIDDADQGSTSHTYNSYGSFTIQQVIHNYDTGCSDSSFSSIVISQIDADFTYTNDSLCFGDELLLYDSTTSTHNVIYDTLVNTYMMGNGDFLFGSVQNYTYPLPGSYEIVHSALNAVGCTDTDTIQIEILELPIADASPSAFSGCAPLDVLFTNTSTTQGNGVPLDFFIWGFYDGTIDTTTSSNPSTSFLFTEENFVVTSLVAHDEFGCVSDTAYFITEITKPTADFLVDSVVCDLENFTAVNQSVGNIPLSYQWYLDGNLENISVDYTDQIDDVSSSLYNSVAHTLTLITTDVNGCLDTMEVPIIVSMPHADANFTFSGATLNAQGEFVCPPVFASLTDSSSSYGTITGWDWTFGNGNSSTLENPQNTYVYAGTYTSTLSITDEFGCVDDSIFTDYVTINGPSGDPEWLSVGTFCEPEYQFYVQNQVGVTNVEWGFGDGTLINDTSALIYVYDTTGVYSPTVIISDDFGCEIPYLLPPISNAINVIDAFFTSSMLEGEVSEIFTFYDGSTSSSDPIVDWNWDFGTWSQLNNTNSDIDYDWSYNGIQNVTLTVSDANGCSSSYTIQVMITAEFNVPNVFTPNGDGINDLFEMDFDVFNGFDYVILNRWGNVIIEGQDHHGPVLWDGTNQSQEKCSGGVYFYKISGSLLDGTEIVRHGHVTLVR